MKTKIQIKRTTIYRPSDLEVALEKFFNAMDEHLRFHIPYEELEPRNAFDADLDQAVFRALRSLISNVERLQSSLNEIDLEELQDLEECDKENEDILSILFLDSTAQAQIYEELWNKWLKNFDDQQIFMLDNLLQYTSFKELFNIFKEDETYSMGVVLDTLRNLYRKDKTKQNKTFNIK